MKVATSINNKYILLILSFLALINFLGYISLEKYDSMALFVVMFLLTGYFSKNLSINLLVTIIVTSLVSINNNMIEGFKGNKKEEKENLENKETYSAINKTCKKDSDCPKGKCKNNKCVKKTGFQNNVPSSSPAKVSSSSDDEEMDAAAKMEQAYNSLNSLVEGTGLKNMAKETKELVNQQKELMGTLTSMAPALSKAKETLEGMNLPSMGEMNKLLKKLS